MPEYTNLQTDEAKEVLKEAESAALFYNHIASLTNLTEQQIVEIVTAWIENGGLISVIFMVEETL